MRLQEMSWPAVKAVSKDVPVVVPIRIGLSMSPVPPVNESVPPAVPTALVLLVLLPSVKPPVLNVIELAIKPVRVLLVF